MHNFGSTHHAGDELWHVKLATGEVCLMTLDQLTHAYRRGEVNGETYVCREGSTEWGRLGVVATFESGRAGRTRVRVSSYPPPPSVTSRSGIRSYPPPPDGPRSTAPLSANIEVEIDDTWPNPRLVKRSTTVWIGIVGALFALGFVVMKLTVPDTAVLTPNVAAAPTSIEKPKLDEGVALLAYSPQALVEDSQRPSKGPDAGSLAHARAPSLTGK